MGAGRKVAIWVEISQMNRLSKVWYTLILAQPSNQWNNLNMVFVYSVLFLYAEPCCAKKRNPGKKFPTTTGFAIKTLEYLECNLREQQGHDPAALGAVLAGAAVLGPGCWWAELGSSSVSTTLSPLVFGGFSWQDGDGKAGPGEVIWGGTFAECFTLEVTGFDVASTSGQTPVVWNGSLEIYFQIKVEQGAACTGIVAFSELFAQLWLL